MPQNPTADQEPILKSKPFVPFPYCYYKKYGINSEVCQAGSLNLLPTFVKKTYPTYN